jgi:sulfofructose kinase
MSTVLSAGLAVHDLVFRVPTIPSGEGKAFASSVEETAGGPAAVAAIAAARLGSHVRLVAMVGDDPRGDALLADLAGEGVDVGSVFRSPTAGTPVSAILVDDEGGRRIINHTSPGLHDGEWDVPDLTGVDAVLVDSRWPSMGGRILEAARAAGIPGILDLDVTPDPDAVRPLAAAASHVIASAAALRAHTGIHGVAEALLAFDGVGEVAVTDGADPVRYRRNGTVEEVPPVPTTVVNTLGAGDVFHGGAAHAMAEGRRFEEALAIGTAAAAYACAHGGGRVGAPTTDQLDGWRNDQWN